MNADAKQSLASPSGMTIEKAKKSSLAGVEEAAGFGQQLSSFTEFNQSKKNGELFPRTRSPLQDDSE